MTFASTAIPIESKMPEMPGKVNCTQGSTAQNQSRSTIYTQSARSAASPSPRYTRRRNIKMMATPTAPAMSAILTAFSPSVGEMFLFSVTLSVTPRLPDLGRKVVRLLIGVAAAACDDGLPVRDLAVDGDGADQLIAVVDVDGLIQIVLRHLGERFRTLGVEPQPDRKIVVVVGGDKGVFDVLSADDDGLGGGAILALEGYGRGSADEFEDSLRIVDVGDFHPNGGVAVAVCAFCDSGLGVSFADKQALQSAYRAVDTRVEIAETVVPYLEHCRHAARHIKTQLDGAGISVVVIHRAGYRERNYRENRHQNDEHAYNRKNDYRFLFVHRKNLHIVKQVILY